MTELDKILYLELFQPFAQYRNPFTFFYAQTYPLPPKSTIIGLLQNATGNYYDKDKPFQDLKISVHGSFSAIYFNYLQFIKGMPKINEKGELIGSDKRPLYFSAKKSQRTPTPQQEIFSIKLHILIKGKDELLKFIYESLKISQKLLYLGKSEDICYIRHLMYPVKSIEERKVKDTKLYNATYIKRENSNHLKHQERLPIYSIPEKSEIKIRQDGELNKITSFYQILSAKKENLKRETKFVPVYFIGAGTRLIFNEQTKIQEFKLGSARLKVFEEGWL